MRSNVLVYLSGPITAAHGYTVEQNVADGVRALTECIERGLPAFCPHVTAVVALPYETMMAYDFAVIDRCTHVLMLPRWETSNGAIREAKYATLRSVPVFYSLDRLIAHVDGAAHVEPKTT